MTRWHVTLVCRWIIGLLFIAAAVPKILDPMAFAKIVSHYQVLPDGWINLAAIFLPWAEVVCGLSLLLLPRLRDAAALLILLMLLVFTGAIINALNQGIDISCGCFTVDPKASKVGWSKVALNGFFIVVAAKTFADALCSRNR